MIAFLFLFLSGGICTWWIETKQSGEIHFTPELQGNYPQLSTWDTAPYSPRKTADTFLSMVLQLPGNIGVHRGCVCAGCARFDWAQGVLRHTWHTHPLRTPMLPGSCCNTMKRKDCVVIRVITTHNADCPTAQALPSAMQCCWLLSSPLPLAAGGSISGWRVGKVPSYSKWTQWT